jgi:hypothetical protein
MSKINYSNVPFIDQPLNHKSQAASEALDAAVDATAAARSSASQMIQKRGFTYTGDTHNGWGLTGIGGAGMVGGSPHFGRGIDSAGGIAGFSLQPFGIGANGLLSGLTPSLFSGNGSGARYSKTTHIAHLKIAYAMEAYKGFGVVKNVIDLMCNFASEGIKIIHKAPKIQAFYRHWWDAIDGEGRVKDILRAYYKTSNVHIYTTMGKIDGFSYKKMRSARGTTEGETQTQDPNVLDTNDPASPKRKELVDKERSDPLADKEIPWRYTILNPLQMDLRGSKYFGQSEWVFIPDEETKNEIKNRYSTEAADVLDDTEVNLPPEFTKLTQDGNAIVLDQAKLWVMHYMKDDHEDWADPMIWPVMNDILYKQQLRAMDMSVANSVINAITIFKLGDIANGFIADKRHFDKLGEMLRTPTYSHNIVWNDAIKMESNYPPIEKILSIDKYKSVDRDILAGLGIPGILIGGSEGGSYSNAFLQVRTLLERLEEGRREVLKWVNSQLRMIAEIMGHREIPIIKFGQMSLKDEQAEKTLILQLLDRNIISAERVHEVFDIETEIEIERMRREKQLIDEEDIMTKFGPFKDPMNMMDQEEMMDKTNEFEMQQIDKQGEIKLQTDKMKLKQTGLPSQRKSTTKTAGRPSNTKGIPQAKKRNTKPKGMGIGSYTAYEELKTEASRAYKSTEDFVFSLMRELRGAQYNKSLSQEDRMQADELTLALYANVVDLDTDPKVLSESLGKLHSNDEFMEIYDNLTAGKQLDIEQKRKYRVMAMTIYLENKDE